MLHKMGYCATIWASKIIQSRRWRVKCRTNGELSYERKDNRSYGAIAASRCCIIEVAFLSASAFVIDSNDPCCGGKEENREGKEKSRNDLHYGHFDSHRDRVGSIRNDTHLGSENQPQLYPGGCGGSFIRPDSRGAGGGVRRYIRRYPVSRWSVFSGLYRYGIFNGSRIRYVLVQKRIRAERRAFGADQSGNNKSVFKHSFYFAVVRKSVLAAVRNAACPNRGDDSRADYMRSADIKKADTRAEKTI